MENEDTNIKLQRIENNQKKIIEQNKKIISILERINTNIRCLSNNRHS